MPPLVSLCGWHGFICHYGGKGKGQVLSGEAAAVFLKAKVAFPERSNDMLGQAAEQTQEL